MRCSLEHLHRAELVEGPSGPRNSIPGMLGVFAYGGNEKAGDLCLFKPDDPDALNGKAKLRPSPGNARQDGSLLRFTAKDENKSYVWRLVGDEITDPDETREFLAFAESNDRIICRLMEEARRDIWTSDLG